MMDPKIIMSIDKKLKRKSCTLTICFMCALNACTMKSSHWIAILIVVLLPIFKEMDKIDFNIIGIKWRELKLGMSKWGEIHTRPYYPNYLGLYRYEWSWNYIEFYDAPNFFFIRELLLSVGRGSRKRLFITLTLLCFDTR